MRIGVAKFLFFFLSCSLLLCVWVWDYDVWWWCPKSLNQKFKILWLEVYFLLRVEGGYKVGRGVRWRRRKALVRRGDHEGETTEEGKRRMKARDWNEREFVRGRKNKKIKLTNITPASGTWEGSETPFMEALEVLNPRLRIFFLICYFFPSHEFWSLTSLSCFHPSFSLFGCFSLAIFSSARYYLSLSLQF